MKVAYACYVQSEVEEHVSGLDLYFWLSLQSFSCTSDFIVLICVMMEDFVNDMSLQIAKNVHLPASPPDSWCSTCWDRSLTFSAQFISSRGNEYFCEIDEEYLTDRFNLTGLNTDVQYYSYALDLVTDVFELDCDDDMREQIEKSARHLYGLVHARYITTTRGLAKMVGALSIFWSQR